MTITRDLVSDLHPWLRRLTAGAAGLLAFSGLMSLLDPRLVLGVSTWAKPAKFAIAVAITAFTLALVLRALQPSKGVERSVRVVASMFTLELAIITFQAARAVPSHFNNRTLFDLVLFQVAGVGILAATVAFSYLTVRAFRQRFGTPAIGWGVRLGLVSLLLGSAVGGIMPRPTAAQIESLAAGRPTPLVGAHTVGAVDGGPGLPVTGWSRDGGDLRIPHFVGLHGFQALPLFGWWLARRRPARAGALTVVAGGSYLALTACLLVQALRGQPLLAPDGLTLALWATLAALTTLALAAVVAVGRRSAGVPVRLTAARAGQLR